ncbi:MAG TPA: tetratricopeptide repeat protein [Chroococcidiopsis sp.]
MSYLVEGQTVSKRTTFLSLLCVVGLWSAAQPAIAQALVPRVVQLDAEKLEQQGLGLAQEAAQLAQFQQVELALPRAQLATQLAPGNAQIWSLLGSLYLQQERWDDGISALQRARSLDSQNEAILFALGSAYFRKEDYNRSIQYLQAGLRVNGEVPGALFDLGNAYYMLEQYDQAIAEYSKAVDIEATFWPAVNNIGLALYEKGDVDGAVRQWQNAVSIDNSQPEPQLAMAVALYARGDTEQALLLGETALRLDNRYADIEFLRQNLWGDRLLGQAQTFLQLPRIQDTLAQINSTPRGDN